MASCVTVGKLAIGLFVITCNQDVFLLWVLLGSSLSFLFCGFTATGLSGFFFFSFIYVLLVCVVISHELKKNLSADTSLHFLCYFLLIQTSVIPQFYLPSLLTFIFSISMPLFA